MQKDAVRCGYAKETVSRPTPSILLKNSKFRRTPPRVAKALDSPLEKLDSPNDTLGWVVYITNRQVGYIHSCVHT